MEVTTRPEAVLGAVPLFAALSPRQRASLAGYCRVRRRERGEIIFMEGDEASGFYFMASGRVKIYRMAPDGREAVLHVFGPGEPFGEAAVFQGGRFPANAQCVAAGESLFLPRPALVQSLKDDPDLAMAMLAALSARLRAFAGKIEALTLMETPQRLAAFLLHETSEAERDNPVVTLDVSKALLAGMLGTARETLSRALSRFAEDGAINMEGRTVRVLDRKYLERLVAGVENL